MSHLHSYYSRRSKRQVSGNIVLINVLDVIKGMKLIELIRLHTT